MKAIDKGRLWFAASNVFDVGLRRKTWGNMATLLNLSSGSTEFSQTHELAKRYNVVFRPVINSNSTAISIFRNRAQPLVQSRLLFTRLFICTNSKLTLSPRTHSNSLCGDNSSTTYSLRRHMARQNASIPTSIFASVGQFP